MDLSSLEVRIARSDNLPVLPEVASQIMRIVDNPNTAGRDLQELIERDPVIVAKILRVANSAAYGLVGIPSVSRAMGVLGQRTIRSVVMGVACHQAFLGSTTSRHLDKVRLWQHSLAVATAARVLGKMTMGLKAEELYSAGMIHDIGVLVLDRLCPDELDTSILLARQEGIPLHDAQSQIMDCDQAQVGALLARKWGLVEMMHNAIMFHRNPSEDPVHEPTTKLISLSNALANSCGFTLEPGDATEEVCPDMLGSVNMPAEQLEPIKAVLLAEVQRAQEAFIIRPAA